MALSRSTSLILVALAAAVLTGAALWFRSWGALALLLVAAAGWVWYRMQVRRGEAAGQFFGEAGEETRLTGLQSPGEMPVDRPAGSREQAR